MAKSEADVTVDAIQDLTRVVLALSGAFSSRADAIRRLTEFGIPPARVAALLSIPPKQVHAELAKARTRALRS